MTTNGGTAEIERTDEHANGREVEIWDVEPGDPRLKWPQREHAAATLGVSLRKLDYMVRSGEVPSIKIRGVRRFDPAELAALNGAPGTEGDGPLIRALTSLFGQQVRAYGEATDQIAELVKLVTGPGNQLWKTLADMNTELLKQNVELSKQLREQAAEVERARSETHLREMEVQAAAAKGKRMDDVVAILRTTIPRVIDQAAGIKRIKEAIAKFEPEQLEALQKGGFFDQSTLVYLLELRQDELEQQSHILSRISGKEKKENDDRASEPKRAGV